MASSRCDLTAALSAFTAQISSNMRDVLNESEYFNLAYAAVESYQQAFDEACARLDMRLDMLLEYNKQHGLGY